MRREFPHCGRGPSRAGARQTSGEWPDLVQPSSIWSHILFPSVADAWRRGEEQNKCAVILPLCFLPAAGKLRFRGFLSHSERMNFCVSWWIIFFPFVSEFQPSCAWGLCGSILQPVLHHAAGPLPCSTAMRGFCLRAGGEAASGSPFPFCTLCGVFLSCPFPPFSLFLD